MPTVPFEIHHSSGHKISGLLSLEDEFLVMEIRVQKWGSFKQRPETVKAEFGVIDSLRLERGFFTDRLYLVPKKLELLDAVPGTHKGEIRLKVEKRHREQAQRLVDEVFAKKQKKS